MKSREHYSERKKLLQQYVPNIFESRDEIYMHKFKYIISILESTNKYPSCSSLNSEERSHATWLQSMRIAKKTNSKNQEWVPLLDELAMKTDYPNMFNENWEDDLLINTIITICNFYIEYNKTPKMKAINKTEANLGKQLSIIRSRIKKTYYSSDMIGRIYDVVNSYGVSNILDQRNFKPHSLKEFEEICIYYITNKRIPEYNSTDAHIRHLRKKLDHILCSIHNTSSSKSHVYDEYHIIAEQYKCNEILIPMNSTNTLKNKLNNNMYDVCKFYKINGNPPSSISTDQHEKTIGTFLSNVIAYNNKNKLNVFDIVNDDYKKILIEYECTHLFIYDGVLKFIEVCQYTNKNGIPKNVISNKYEKTLYDALCNAKSVISKSKNKILIQDYYEIAEKYNCLSLLPTKVKNNLN